MLFIHLFSIDNSSHHFFESYLCGVLIDKLQNIYMYLYHKLTIVKSFLLSVFLLQLTHQKQSSVK